MTKEQNQTANTVIFGVFCLAMIGVYGWSCWQGQRATRRIQDRLLASAEARFAREEAPDGEV